MSRHTERLTEVLARLYEAEEKAITARKMTDDPEAVFEIAAAENRIRSARTSLEGELSVEEGIEVQGVRE